MKKLLVILLTLGIAVGSLSCTAGQKETETTTKEFLTEITTETTTEVTEEPTEAYTNEIATETTTVEKTTAKELTEPTEAYSKPQTAKKPTQQELPIAYSEKTTRKAMVTSSDGTNLGQFKITVYTPGSDGGVWGYQTATGVRSKHLQTCAVDPDVIPLGSTIEVNGLTLLACDTGSAVQGNVIDIFYDGSDSEACQWVSDFGTYHNVQKV